MAKPVEFQGVNFYYCLWKQFADILLIRCLLTTNHCLLNNERCYSY
jgi:hypothetical protein